VIVASSMSDRMTRPTTLAWTDAMSNAARAGSPKDWERACAHASAPAVGGWRISTTMPTGTKDNADAPAAAAGPSAPGSRRPTCRLSRM